MSCGVFVCSRTYKVGENETLSRPLLNVQLRKRNHAIMTKETLSHRIRDNGNHCSYQKKAKKRQTPTLQYLSMGADEGHDQVGVPEIVISFSADYHVSRYPGYIHES